MKLFKTFLCADEIREITMYVILQRSYLGKVNIVYAK